MDLSNIAKLIISGIYYILMGILALFSIFGVYILLRYGRSLAVTGLVSILYSIFFLTAFLASFASLKAIQGL